MSLHAPPSPGVRPASADGTRRRPNLFVRRSYEGGLIATHPPLHGSLTVEVVSARGLHPLSSASAAASPNLSASNLAVWVVARPAPEARPKKGKSDARRLDGETVVWNQKLHFDLKRVETLGVSLHGQSRGRSDATIARGDLPLLNLQLQRAVPVTLDVPLVPQGELRLVLTFEDATPLFGLDLAAVCAREQEDVPCIVRKCCEAVEDFGLESEGIYRVPGNKPAIDQLVHHFSDDAKGFHLAAKDVLHINNLASLLKQYLQALPEPVMTHKARAQFLEALAMEDGPAKVNRFIDLLLTLPTANRNTSVYILAHLHKVVTSDTNKMDASNLAICFGPTMLGSENDDPNITSGSLTQLPSAEMLESLRRPRAENEVIRYILTHPEIINHCARGLKTQSQHSVNGSQTDLSDVTTLSTADDSETTQRVIFQFHACDSSKTGQLSGKEFRLLCFELGRLLCAKEEALVFERLCGPLAGIPWPSFRAWWDYTERTPLSADARASLENAVKFFRAHVAGDGRSATLAELQKIRDDILASNPNLEQDEFELPALSKMHNGVISLKEYLRWLLEHDML